jgi:hypothetical protein
MSGGMRRGPGLHGEARRDLHRVHAHVPALRRAHLPIPSPAVHDLARQLPRRAALRCGRSLRGDPVHRRQRVWHWLSLQRHLAVCEPAGMRAHSLRRREPLRRGPAVQARVVSGRRLRVRANSMRRRLCLSRGHPLQRRIVASGQPRVRVRAVRRRLCLPREHPLHHRYPAGVRPRLYPLALQQIRRGLRLRVLRERRVLCRSGDVPVPAGLAARRTVVLEVSAEAPQQGMLDRLGRRLAKRGLAGPVELRLCRRDDFGLADERGRCDLAPALHVVPPVALPPEPPVGSTPLAAVSGVCSAALRGAARWNCDPGRRTPAQDACDARLICCRRPLPRPAIRC